VQRQPIQQGMQAAGLECHVQPFGGHSRIDQELTAMVQAPLSWSWISW